ncbi:unnamed protein product, partial [Rotaria magnacalcarata]
PSAKQMANDADKFYSDLQDTINNVSTNDMLIIMGDLNARVGGNQQQLASINSVGPFTVDVENENGARLVEWCEINNIVVSNTFFQHKLLHQTSWMHPGNKIWHMIDYTLVNKKFRSSVEDVRMYRRASGGIETDHHLMRTKIKIHLKSRRKGVLQKKTSIDAVKLKDEKLVEAFQKGLRERVDDANVDTISIDEKYEMFVSHLKEKAREHFILDKKSMAFVERQNRRHTNLEADYRNKYKRLRKLAKTKIEHRQEKYWDEVCERIEKSIKSNDPATAFSIIRRLKGGSKRVENMPIGDKNGKLLVNSTDQLERWREYFCELLNVHSTVDPYVINEVQITTPSRLDLKRQNKQPSFEEVKIVLNQMKSRKAPGSDEVTADILKAGGEKVIEEASVAGVKFLYSSNDFFHGSREKYENVNVLALLYADDLVAMCESTDDLEKFIRSFEKITQKFGLTMSVKKTCIMTLQQLKEDQHGKVLKGHEVDHPNIDINIQNQKIETVDSFTYLGCTITRDQRQDTQLEIRLAKAARAFNMLRYSIWHRKSVSIVSRLRIFRACVHPVLLYGSEVWSLTTTQEHRITSFCTRCLRTIIGVNLGDRM